MGKIFVFAVIVVLAGGLWFFGSDQNQVKNVIGKYIENGDILTLEARYTPEQIMDNHRKELLIDDQHSYQNYTLKFYPYLLMEVKYTHNDKKSRENAILWSLVDGEMVIDMDSWEKTHGFEDAVLAQATKNEFKILNALAKNGGSLSYDQLLKDLHLEPEVVDPWIDSVKEKHLITLKGNVLQLHFQNPKMAVAPQTKMTQHLVTKPCHNANFAERKFSQNQITKAAKAAFGNDFSIRQSSEVFLPVYSIEVLNPDGSIFTSYWNALNGKRIINNYLTITP